ncbi:hypothetical protein CXB51_035205 [Gossypium anomalum]|uniref:Retrotransposon gag protein n=1 Tax=Gossypium anomalum TaxID=47600 RepID=A0A8J6CJK9_9ROSI|nr:hypothetical protein CXB51_035205 [Gossypium anomalum]
MGRRGKTARPGLPHTSITHARAILTGSGNPLGLLLFDEEIDRTARRNQREIRRSLRYTEGEQEDDIPNKTEEMAENQENPLPPAIAPDQDEDPNTNLANFLEFCDTFKINGVSDDAIRLRCPHHGLPLWLQVQTFYNGVNPPTRQMIDAAAGGTINNKTPEAAYEFIEEMSLNNYQWQVIRTKPTKTVGVYNVDVVNMLSNQVEIQNKKIDGLLGSMQVHPVMRCDSSGRGVHTKYQPFNPTTEEEQVHYMGNNNSRSQNNPYSNTYNAGWRNHPNFSWGGQENQMPQNPPGFQQPPYQQEKKLNLKEMLPKFIAVSETRFQNTETVTPQTQPRRYDRIRRATSKCSKHPVLLNFENVAGVVEDTFKIG